MSDASIIAEVASSQQKPEGKQPGGFLDSPHLFNSILNWLADFVQMTKKEQEEAGIDLSDQGLEVLTGYTLADKLRGDAGGMTIDSPLI
jgi:hypothetical protein